jgi:hypothetical protein
MKKAAKELAKLNRNVSRNYAPSLRQGEILDRYNNPMSPALRMVKVFVPRINKVTRIRASSVESF